MSVLVSIATGNFLTAGTWGLVDNTSYLNAENATESPLTTLYSDTRSAAFTPGAITVSHIGIKLCERIGTTGTISVSLRNATLGLDDFVAGTEVTINVADLPSALEADLNGGWIFFKLASPVLLLAATNYNVQAKTSNATQVDLWCDATVDNLARALITTTTQAPVAGDDMIVAGEKTGVGTANNFIVTMNETVTTDYGTASTSLVTPAIAICSGGILRSGVVAATTYNLKVSGNIIVYSGGELDLGTVGAEMPRNSSMTLLLDSGANVDFGLTVRNLGTFVSQGLSRTVAKNIVSCKLNTDEAAAQTILGVDTDTGWLSGDEIAIASTSRTASECEVRILSANANAADMTVTVGLTNAHSGTSPTQAEVILLTRNVKIQGASATLQAYVDIKATATVDVDWTEFKWLGSNTANRRGIDCAVTTGSVNIQYSSLHNFSVGSSRGLNMTGASGTGLTFSNNVTFSIANNNFVNVANSGSWIVNNNIFMLNTDGSQNMVVLSDIGGTFTNNTIVGTNGSGVALTITEVNINGVVNFSGCVIHSNGGVGLLFNSNTINSNFSNFTIWRNGSNGLDGGSGVKILDCNFINFTMFGNNFRNISASNFGAFHNVIFDNLVSNGDSSFSTPVGISFGSVPTLWNEVYFINCDFSTVSGIKTAHNPDFEISSSSPTTNALSGKIYLINTKLGAATEISNQSNLRDNSFISSQKHDQTAGLHKTWKKYGTITIETTTVHTGGQSVKLTPNNASSKLESGSFFIAVANGATLTPSVFVYENAAYNGARARLILKRNDALGITADTVIDTATVASDAAWEALTGTTPAATDDGVMEFVIDCDGTAGNLFVDSFSVT